LRPPSLKIGEKSEYFNFSDAHREAATQEQSRLEYNLVLILAYLWNKNIKIADQEIRDKCIRLIARPSIGTIIDISRSLDIGKEALENNRLKKFRETVNQYPIIRNEKIGHGFSFDDDSPALYTTFKSLYQKLIDSPPEFMKGGIDIIKVISDSDGKYKAVNFRSNGEKNLIVISDPRANIAKGEIYIKKSQTYYKISPFIAISGEDDFYIYSFIDDRLSGRATYNKLINTGRASFDVSEIIESSIDSAQDRRRSSNGTIINNYENNYKKYIDTDIVRKLLKFLKRNESTVFATLWGHGGVGKTAAIQRVCETLIFEEGRHFDYIVFASAKDRYFNFYRGEIEQLDGSADSLEAIARLVNKTVSDEDSTDLERIINFKGKVLIVIDDYETFPQEEKIKIVEFIKNLKINHHKVVITTRSANLITGEEIEVEELSPKESIAFFDSVLSCELGLKPETYTSKICTEEFEENLHEFTSGRPLFIFQAAVMFGETGSIKDAINVNYSNQPTAIDFLYGRILNYLSIESKKIFWAMGLLVSHSDLSNLVSKLKYILNMEGDEQRFDQAMEELIKLKIVKITDSKIFKIYSPEILNIMKASFIDEGDAGGIKHRLTLVGMDKKLDTDMSLLDDANNSRYSRKPAEVINKYRHIISRPATPEEIRVIAVTQLVKYLIDDEGNFEQGIGVLESHYHTYSSNPLFIKSYSAYMWRGDRSHKNTSILALRHILNSPEVESISDKLFFLSSLMRNETSLLIEDREDLKTARDLGEVEEEEYFLQFGEQRDSFFRIYKHPGEELLNTIRRGELENFDNETKLNCISGLSSLIEVCIRRQMFEEIDEILSYVFNQLKYNYHDNLKQKLSRINRIRDSGHKDYDDYIIPGSIGDRLQREPKTQKVGTLGKLLMSAMDNADDHPHSKSLQPE